MRYIYVLKSIKNGKRYIGTTRMSLEVRLRQHHCGTNKWTKENGPFDLLYFEKYATFSEARKRELYLKSTSGRRFIDKVVVGRMAQFPPSPTKIKDGITGCGGSAINSKELV